MLVFQQTVEGATGHEAESGFNQNSVESDSGFSNTDGLFTSVPPSAAPSYLSILPHGRPEDGANRNTGGCIAEDVSHMHGQRMEQFTTNWHPRANCVQQTPLTQPGGDSRAGPSHVQRGREH